jgi:hypothetical protein
VRVRDEAAWQERRAALTEDGEIGQEFLKFVEDWADTAERDYDDQTSTTDWIRQALPKVEERHGRVDFMFLGQMLAVLAEHWEYGPQLMRGLTPIERRLVEDLTLLKVAVEQKKAETHGNL